MKRTVLLSALALAFLPSPADAFGRRARGRACQPIPVTCNRATAIGHAQGNCPAGRDCPPNCRLIPYVYRFDRPVSAAETEFTIRNDRYRPVRLYLAHQEFVNNYPGRITCIFGGRPIVVPARSEYDVKIILPWYRDSNGRWQGTLLLIYDMEEL